MIIHINKLNKIERNKFLQQRNDLVLGITIQVWNYKMRMSS